MLASDVAPLRRLNTESAHDWAIADSALRILNNVLLIHQDLRGPFADSPPLPEAIGGAAQVLNMLSPVATLLESIFFPHLCDPIQVAQHMDVVSSCLKPHAPGPRGATSALDATFLGCRVLFLSTVLRANFNQVLVQELDGLASIRDVLSVLTRTRIELLLDQHQDPEPVVLETCESALSEVLRLLFNVSLYCPPQAPY